MWEVNTRSHCKIGFLFLIKKKAVPGGTASKNVRLAWLL